MDAQQPSPVFRDRLPLVTPAQMIALGLVAVSIGWAVWLLRDRPSSEEVELLAGMALPSSEMAIMEAAFDRAQLTDHRTDGGRVWVPRSRQSAYMRALVDAEALPREFGGSLRRALEKNSPWQSRAVQSELLRVATQEELSLVICSMPGIERAAVLYDTENRPGLEGGGPAKTASVNVRTQPDMEMDPVRVLAIRVLVSASIAGLSPERVAVTDLRSGRVYAGPLDADTDREAAAIAAADPALARKIAHEHHLATKVRQSIAFVKGATVDVSIDFVPAVAAATPVPPVPVEPDPRAPEPPQPLAAANAPAEIGTRPTVAVVSAPPAVLQPPAARTAAADGPEAILVSIAIPDAYFQSASRAALERAGQPTLQPLAIEQQEIDRIRRHVLALLPATRDPTLRQVIVTSFPVAQALGARREPTAVSRAAAVAVPAAISEASAAPLHQPADLLAAVVAGRFADIPRPVWLAGMSVCVGLLAGFLWWSGSRHNHPTHGDLARRRVRQPRIDWSGSDAQDDAEPMGGSGGAGIGRAAVFILAIVLSSASVRADVPAPLPAIAPLPEAVLPEPPIPTQRLQSATLQTRSALAPPLTAASRVPQSLQALPLDVRTGGPTAGGASGPTVSAGMAGKLSDWKLLAAIAAAFAAVAAATVLSKRRTTLLPPDVFEVLGEGSLGGQHAVRIVRFGPKTLLVGVSAAGCHTLAELSDPQATACIAAACRGVHPPIRPLSPRPGNAPRTPLPQSQRSDGEAA